jgi:hypothetical protein
VNITVVGLLSDGPFIMPLGSATGPLVISAYDPSGAVVDTGQAGVTLPVKLDGVASGSNWFAVEDATKAGTIASTLQPISVGTDNPTNVALSAISAGPLAATQIDRVPLGGPASGEATVVLVFRQGVKSVPGITVTGNPGNSTVAYYAGNGYQTQDMGTNVTGAQSTVLIAHVPVAARLRLPLKYTVANKPFDIQVDVAPTFVTWMLVDVP